MTAKQQELLSAFVDGELNAQELDELLAMMENNDNAKDEYLRYQLASDTLRGYGRHTQPIDLLAKVSQALENEPTYHQSESSAKAAVLTIPNWFWKQTAGLAAAASIGALAVVSVIDQPQMTVSPHLVQVDPVNAVVTAITASNRWTVGEQEVEDRLNNYLVNHNEYASTSGVFSYARVVSYGEE
jgi:sigma-E factor negative regulatory protein RseA